MTAEVTLCGVSYDYKLNFVFDGTISNFHRLRSMGPVGTGLITSFNINYDCNKIFLSVLEEHEIVLPKGSILSNIRAFSTLSYWGDKLVVGFESSVFIPEVNDMSLIDSTHFSDILKTVFERYIGIQ